MLNENILGSLLIALVRMGENNICEGSNYTSHFVYYSMKIFTRQILIQKLTHLPVPNNSAPLINFWIFVGLSPPFIFGPTVY